jgi:hypothetical protein
MSADMHASAWTRQMLDIVNVQRAYCRSYLAYQAPLHAVRLDHDIADLSAHGSRQLPGCPSADRSAAEAGQAARTVVQMLHA